ncbi:MAG TPA: Ig-like domain-containing protein [Thermodesulfobacteriota bacterium]|nr:Ig-like domain-containing protein [Thermodesulfobacteriota bacterium]
MKVYRTFVLMACIGLFTVFGGYLTGGYDVAAAEAVQADGAVAISSPEDGAVVGETVEVAFEIVDKGSRGDHVHLFLDGKLLDPVYTKTYTVKGLSKGEHTIEVKLVTKNHVLLGPSASAKVTVK